MGCCSPPPPRLPHRHPPKRHCPRRQPFIPSFSSISIPNNFTLCCCSTPADSNSSLSSPPSFDRRWYSPLRRRPYDQFYPELLRRQWVEADGTQQQLASQERFTVVSYNILGDQNAYYHRDMYPNVPSPFMKWAHRKRVLCDELIGYSPDIICLQEVDKYFDLLSFMEKAGYSGSYQRRTGGYVDGCATFWRTEKFRLLEGESFEYKGFGLRDNVVQVSVFETCKAESRRLVVGNIHVLFNPHRGEVKLAQLRFLLSRAHILSEKWGNIPVILAGDFNSTPRSAIYKFLSSSELNIKLYERKEMSGQRGCRPAQVFGVKGEKKNAFNLQDSFLKNCWNDEEVKVATGNSDCHLAIHPFKLNSSYASVKGSTRTRGLNGEPVATSYHSKFLGTVDYLWYSEGLVPIRVLDTLPLDMLGSDHLALVCEYAFTQGTKEGNATS
ncbi:hypothetical protein Tsubulata_136953 [Turnera subulata]|uniref:Endonuclease/exonuclease/phosphatase domain-containing protein n=1 Tax=Turnera subulata TaxID=218843 RepID=A0A9Q0J0M2_9ROSI|nr:hypothetical protein Tsubulata_136953 [Turnera subulata]